MTPPAALALPYGKEAFAWLCARYVLSGARPSAIPGSQIAGVALWFASRPDAPQRVREAGAAIRAARVQSETPPDEAQR